MTLDPAALIKLGRYAPYAVGIFSSYGLVQLVQTAALTAEQAGWMMVVAFAMAVVYAAYLGTVDTHAKHEAELANVIKQQAEAARTAQNVLVGVEALLGKLVERTDLASRLDRIEQEIKGGGKPS